MGEITHDGQMRAFIGITDELLEFYSAVTRPEMIVEEVTVKEEPMTEHALIAECRDLVFKMRAFMEDASGGEYALGVETGMQRAADMVENLIRRHEKGDGFEQQ